MGNLFLSDELVVFLLVGAMVLLFSKAVKSGCSVMSSSGSSFGLGFSRCVLRYLHRLGPRRECLAPCGHVGIVDQQIRIFDQETQPKLSRIIKKWVLLIDFVGL